MSTIAIIPAKGTSARIPGKNRKLFHGRPMVVYSIETAFACGIFDRVVVSTDDKDIAMMSWDCGASIQLRPSYLSGGEVGTQEVMKYSLLGHGFDYACCIYATAPMLTPADLKYAYWHLVSAEIPYVYVPGYYYWGQVLSFLGDVPLEFGEKHEIEASRYIDINTPEDWVKAEAMYAALHPEVA